MTGPKVGDFDAALSYLNAEKSRIEISGAFRFPELALGLIRAMAASRPIRVLEIGAGRSPLFTPDALPDGVAYVIQDVLQSELDLCPFDYERTCFDACGPASAPAPDLVPVDLILSRMVAEHLDDAAGFYRLQAGLLNPGGLFLHLHPTLYAFPFLVNAMLPTGLSKWIVETLYPHRRADGQEPVFPARYDWCTGLERETRRREALGFEGVDRVRLFRHGYYKGVPALDRLHGWCADRYRRLGWNLFSAYVVDFGRRSG